MELLPELPLEELEEPPEEEPESLLLLSGAKFDTFSDLSKFGVLAANFGDCYSSSEK